MFPAYASQYGAADPQSSLLEQGLFWPARSTQNPFRQRSALTHGAAPQGWPGCAAGRH